MESGFDDDANLMASLLDSEPAQGLAPVETCPGCASVMAPGMVVCMTCGFNKHTGHAAAVRVQRASKRESSGASALAATAASAVAGNSMILIGSVIGACIGGAIGAGVWAAVAYNTGYQIGWIA